MSGITRRQVLIGGVAGATALTAGVAWAQQKELVANTYGGGWEQGHKQAIAEPLEKKTGAKVILIPMLAKEHVFLRLPMDKLPNAAKLYPQYRPKESYGVPIGASVIGIAYNAKKLKTA